MNETMVSEKYHEAIYVIREVAAQFERPVMLFSGGKDSILMSWLARRRSIPGKIPFPLMHIDTGHNFDETIRYRDWWMKEINANLIVRTVQESIDNGGQGRRGDQPQPQRPADGDAPGRALRVQVRLRHGRRPAGRGEGARQGALLQLSRQVRPVGPQEPAPELWNIFNGMHRPGEHLRAFPISNWTELDVWQYIEREDIELPSLYFTHEREMSAATASSSPWDRTTSSTGSAEQVPVRFRTIGDMTCTGATESTPEHRGYRQRNRRHPRHRARRPRRRQTQRGGDGRPQEAGVFLMSTIDAAEERERTSCALPPPGAWTTARARSSGGCCLTPSRSSRTRWSSSSAQPSSGARRTWTSRF